ncbi:MAG: CpaF family protein [Planctomycetales bacterium]|nr:CpaF family protein [Planctomycetales bacterium]
MQSKEIYAKTTRHFLQPVVDFLDDPTVSEIMINGPDTVYIERQGRLQLAEGVRFASSGALLAAARNIAEYAGRSLPALPSTRAALGRSLDGPHSVDARLPDGSRVHIILPPSSRVGVCLSIRKFNTSALGLADLVQFGTLTSEAAEFLGLAVAMHQNLVVSGGTGSGKTSLLNALSTTISSDERIVVIEDSSELQLQQPHTLYLESQAAAPDGRGAVSIRDLFVDSLRMRPDRILVGEVRRGEALDLVQSMISGHSGSMTTVHASTPRDAAVRLETLCLMSGIELPVVVARMQVASAIHLVVQIRRFPDGSRRVETISECRGLGAEGDYQFIDLYRFQARGHDAQGRLVGQLQATGQQPQFASQIGVLGLADRVKETAKLFAGHL